MYTDITPPSSCETFSSGMGEMACYKTLRDTKYLYIDMLLLLDMPT